MKMQLPTMIWMPAMAVGTALVLAGVWATLDSIFAFEWTMESLIGFPSVGLWCLMMFYAVKRQDHAASG